MRSVRVLRAVAAAWLVCHFAAVCVASVALCCAPATAGSHDPKCCPGVGPGQVCPMHRAKEGDAKTCHLRDGCNRSDSALVAFAGGLGVLSDFSISSVTLQSLEPVRGIAPSAIARAERPDAPPPRA